MNKPHPLSQRYDPRQLSDEELVGRTHSELFHAIRTYEELMWRYQRTLFNVCARYLSNDRDVDDVCQEMILEVLYGLKNFKGRSKLRTWLYNITYNECITQYHKERHKHRLMGMLNLDSLEEAPEGESPKVEERGELGRWPVHVSPVGREILILRFIAEPKFQEIANIMHMGLSTTKMHYKRTLGRLREKLSDAAETQSGKYCLSMREVPINLPPKLYGWLLDN